MLCQQCQLLELQSWTLGLPAAALLCAILIDNILRFWITKNASPPVHIYRIDAGILWAIKWDEQKWASCLNVFKVILHLREIKYFLFDFISIRIGGDNLISCCAGRWRFTPYQTFSFYIYFIPTSKLNVIKLWNKHTCFCLWFYIIYLCAFSLKITYIYVLSHWKLLPLSSLASCLEF